MSIRIQVLEYSRAPVVDGVIVGVKIVGTRSRNGHRYPQEVLDRSRQLYEGTGVYMLHPTRREKMHNARVLDDHIGTLMNIRAGSDGKIGTGLFGDLHIKQSHPMAQFILESDGREFGLSHNVVVEMNDEETEVLEIISVNSVDLVENPATTTNLFEESEEMEMQERDEALTKKLEALDVRLTTVLEAVKEPDPKELSARVAELETQLKEAKGKRARVSTLEQVTDPEAGGDPTPIGNSHDAFLDVVRGFSTIDTKGAQA